MSTTDLKDTRDELTEKEFEVVELNANTNTNANTNPRSNLNSNPNLNPDPREKDVEGEDNITDDTDDTSGDRLAVISEETISIRCTGSPWKPSLEKARSNSWSREDRKHELQARLLGGERERESGFSEV